MRGCPSLHSFHLIYVRYIYTYIRINLHLSLSLFLPLLVFHYVHKEDLIGSARLLGNPILQEEHFQLYSAMSCNDHPRKNGSGAPDSPKRRRQEPSSVPSAHSDSLSLFFYRKYIYIFMYSSPSVSILFLYTESRICQSTRMFRDLRRGKVHREKYSKDVDKVHREKCCSSFWVSRHHQTSRTEKVKKVLLSSEKKACWLAFLLPSKSSCGRSPYNFDPSGSKRETRERLWSRRF